MSHREVAAQLDSEDPKPDARHALGLPNSFCAFSCPIPRCLNRFVPPAVAPVILIVAFMVVLAKRTALPDQCLHSAEADVRPPRRKSGFGPAEWSVSVSRLPVAGHEVRTPAICRWFPARKPRPVGVPGLSCSPGSARAGPPPRASQLAHVVLALLRRTRRGA